MRMLTAAVLAAVLVGSGAGADTPPAPPAPGKEHDWLKQLAGEWAVESEAELEPGKPKVKCSGTESVKSLGGFWVVSEMTADFLGTPVKGVMTVGYDAKAGKYVGTFVCSMEPTLWKYEGTVDGSKLTLNTEGTHPHTGKTVKMRDVLEFKGKDERTTTSQALGDDGKWTTFMTMTAKRKK